LRDTRKEFGHTPQACASNRHDKSLQAPTKMPEILNADGGASLSPSGICQAPKINIFQNGIFCPKSIKILYYFIIFCLFFLHRFLSELYGKKLKNGVIMPNGQY